MKTLLMSISPNISTGYGVVAKNLMKCFLKKKVDVKQLGLQTVGEPYGKEKEWLLPMKEDIYGSDALQHYIPLFGIDAVITIMDHWVPYHHYIPGLLKQLNCKHIAHVTENGVPLGTELLKQLKDADFLVAPSKFVETQLLNAGFKRERVRMIYHGVDTKIFKPIPKKEVKKFKEEIGYKDKFVFLVVATNTAAIQKNWPGVFYAYKIFLAQNPDIKDTILHCHTDMNHPAGFDLQLLAKKFGIEKNVFYIDVKLNAGFPQEEMAKLYNISDCHISSSQGESFGLPILEGMACGIPQIFPNHTTGPELVGEPKTGLLVDLIKMKNGQEFGMTAPSMNDRFWPDPVDMAEKMAIIYKDKKLREKFSNNAIKFAKKFDWEKYIITQWIDFLKYIEDLKEPINYAEKKLGI